MHKSDAATSTACSRATGMIFLSQSEITVPPEQGTSLERAFAARARLVDGHAGFWDSNS
jgi:heme-degrading monooxygenase HmoA